MASATFRIWRGRRDVEDFRTIRRKLPPAWWSWTRFTKSKRNRPAIFLYAGTAKLGNAARVLPR